MVLEDFRGGDGHGRVEENLQAARQSPGFHGLVQEIENFLGALEGEGGDDHIAATVEGVLDGAVQFLDGGLQFLVQAIAVGCLHHHHIGMGRAGRVPQQGAAGVTEIAGEQHGAAPAVLFQFQEDAGRAEDVSGIDEGGANARRNIDGLIVFGRAPEEVHAVEGVEHRIQGLDPLPVVMAMGAGLPAGLVLGLFFLQMGRIEHHQPGQLPGSGRGDDLALEPPPGQQGDATTVIQMGMGQQQVVDLRRVETEGLGILLGQLPPTLEHAAVDEDALAVAFDEMAGAGDFVIGAVEGDFHVLLPVYVFGCFIAAGAPLLHFFVPALKHVVTVPVGAAHSRDERNLCSSNP